MQNTNTTQLTLMDQKRIETNLEDAKKYLNRDYVFKLSKASGIANSPEQVRKERIRLFHIDRIVYDGEDTYSRLLSVYNTLIGIADTCFMIIHGSKSSVDVYLGVRTNQNAASLAGNALENSIKGHFPGTSIRRLGNDECMNVLSKIADNGSRTNRTVVSVAQVPSFRKNAAGEKNAVQEQGMEHFIDTMRGQEYTAMIVADSMSNTEITNLRTNLENIYSDLYSIKTVSMQYGANESLSTQKTVTDSIMTSLTDSIAQGYAYTTTNNSGTTAGSSPSIHTQYNTIGFGYGHQKGSYSGTAVSTGNTNTVTNANTKGSSQAVSDTQGSSQGTSKALTFTRTNKTVEELLTKIDRQLERLKESETFGLWNCAAYFASPDPDVALIAANSYKAAVCGEKSGNEPSYVNCWNDTSNSDTRIVLNSLAGAQTPLFTISRKNGWTCSAGTYISGSELPILMGLPNKSVAGLTVVNMAPFGREVHKIDESLRDEGRPINIGKIRHMGVEEDCRVDLTLDHFSKHILIAGTVGVGKTTLSVMLLKKLAEAGIHFTVIEPVKGEYASLLKGTKDLEIYTDSPLRERMLHINPFIFNEKKISVLSHIDRLIDVFSVCWPLYAAQPALLRECIEESYMRCGWDLSNSVFIGGGLPVFPDFQKLLDVIPEIIERSKFVGESKGTYEGALLTRVGMLTHGMYGQIFNGAGSLSDQALFNHSVVIDLSNLGSTEVISLIMGILMIRLREYCIAQGPADNRPLRHVLVLEEAHNLLKKDNSRNDEGGQSVSGKSVEMLSQIIGEMRGYGEGVMILDQAPSELHPAAVRNTATKVIMRLPETDDQQAAAAALSLTDEQIKELPRLPEQTALVYQTGWLEPVMTKIRKAEPAAPYTPAEITYEQLCHVRGRLAKALLKMYQNDTFSYDRLEQIAIADSTVYEGKKRDLMTLFHPYRKLFKYHGEQFRSQSEKNQFYLRMFNDLLSCGEFLKIQALPTPSEDSKAPYEKDDEFIELCREWKIDAIDKLRYYAKGLSEDEYSILLKILLSAKADSRSLRLIRQVYKALYTHN